MLLTEETETLGVELLSVILWLPHIVPWIEAGSPR